MCMSLTNYSLIPQEMMACGLPCVDLAGRSPEAVFGGGTWPRFVPQVTPICAQVVGTHAVVHGPQ